MPSGRGDARRVIVEELTSAELTERAVTHPYTKKLIAATPSISDPAPVHG